MHHLLVVVVWASIGASLTTAIAIEELAREDIVESERIIGGSGARTSQFPYAAALHYTDNSEEGEFKCTASIISPTTIMTAAHCVVLDDELQPADRFFLIANPNRTAQTVRIDVASVLPHPEYSRPTLENDIAILKTVEEIEFTDEVGPVCIAGPDTPAMQYQNVTAIGWGETGLNVTIPETLQYVEQSIVRNSVCSDLLATSVNENKLCTRGSSTGICKGDSGGPLVHLSADKSPVEIGIASYTQAEGGECGKGSPPLFTRVSSHYDFIMQAAQDDSICVV